VFPNNNVAGIEDIFTGIAQTVKVALPLYAQYVQLQQAKRLASTMKERAATIQRATQQVAPQPTQPAAQVSTPPPPEASTFPWTPVLLVCGGIVAIYILGRGRRQ